MHNPFLWVLAFHIIAVISWMAGMLYLPRLYVYHTQTVPGSVDSERFKIMERKLLRFIMNPAMIATWILGFTLVALNPIYLQQHWLHAKVALVVLMSITHAVFATWRRAFAEDRNIHSEKFFRRVNEVPTLLMVAIIILVTVQPF